MMRLVGLLLTDYGLTDDDLYNTTQLFPRLLLFPRLRPRRP
jgi:hypothetical protein